MHNRIMESAARVFAGELSRSDLGVKGDDSDTSAIVVTPSGAWCRLLFIAGALTEVTESGDMLHCRVADPTGSFALTIGGRRSPLAEAVLALPVPSFVSLTGRVHLYRRDKEAVITIRPDHVRAVDRQVRDQWVVTTGDATLTRLGQMLGALKGTCTDEQVLVAFRHYTPTASTLEELALMVGEALHRVQPKEEIVLSTDSIREMVMEIVRASPGPRGIAVEEVIESAAEQGVAQGAVLAAIESLIVDDECYQPQKGYIKPL